MMKRLIFIFLITLIATSTLAVHAQEETPSPYEIVLQRIEAAEAEGATELWLWGRRLEELPPEIGNLTNLTSLTISNSELTALPSEIGNLTNLEILDLRSNRITELPSEIGNLTNLRWLPLDGNSFDAPLEVMEQGDWAIFEYYANRESESK
jgi:Leucine Rich Repeat (LRR) protein